MSFCFVFYLLYSAGSLTDLFHILCVTLISHVGSPSSHHQCAARVLL